MSDSSENAKGLSFKSTFTAQASLQKRSGWLENTQTILIIQCLYYKNIYPRKDQHKQTDSEDPTQPLLVQSSNDLGLPSSPRVSTKQPDSNLTSLTSLIVQNLKNATKSNIAAVLAVCVAGAAGWAVAWQAGVWIPTPETVNNPADDNLGASILGYTSAVCYLRSVFLSWSADRSLMLPIQRKNTTNHEKLSREVLWG